MKGKYYILKAKNAILNRIRFHAPIVYDTDLDRRLLFEYGVDINKPLFKFDKRLNKRLLKAFELAGKEEDFNLVISTSALGKTKDKQLKKMQNVVVYNKDVAPVSFIEMVNKLNINYPSSSNYNLVYKDKFFKLGNQILNPHFEDFSLEQVLVKDEVFVLYNEFVLNGNNFFIKLQNKSNQEKKVDLELNLPLKKGYYFFKRMQKCIQVENLLTTEKMYLNFICRNAQFSFSNVDGLENSVYCCVNVKLSVNLKAGEESFIYFNYGESRFAFKGEAEIKAFKHLARKQCCEIFNLQVKTQNPKFDNFFNKLLPQKIWINWLNGEVDENLEKKYLSLKSLFVKGTDSLSLVDFKDIGLRELGIFNGEYYKKILVIRSDEKFLRVGRTFFYNINGITNHSLTSKEPIVVSFG